MPNGSNYDIGNASNQVIDAYIVSIKRDGGTLNLQTTSSHQVDLGTNSSARFSLEPDGDFVSLGAYNIDAGDGFLLNSSTLINAAGSTQGTGTAITTGFTAVNGADGTKGVVLPDADIGTFVIIHNDNASSVLKLCPYTSDAINTAGTNNSVDVAAQETVVLFKYSAAQWYGGAMVNF